VLLLATACTAAPTLEVIYDEEIFGCASDGDTPTDTFDPRCKSKRVQEPLLLFALPFAVEKQQTNSTITATGTYCPLTADLTNAGCQCKDGSYPPVRNNVSKLRIRMHSSTKLSRAWLCTHL
jgi:hypothetical protein